MVTSDSGRMGGACSVGTIVWVRRRNGSWWPGRILGLHELSASHLMSPRSGTPVKLLGREDASVDWYNLEKSKRVKEFRCGEFDACIERAEASQIIHIKKREKYARREDAILHALELEKQQKFEYTSNGISSKINGGPRSDSIVLFSSENFTRHNEPIAHGNQKFSLGHDNAEDIPRMRGLQDFELQKAKSKRKQSLSTSWENSHKSIDNHFETFSRFDNITVGADQASTSRNMVSVKRKRSCGGAINDLFVKKRDRRRPLVQVLQSSEKLPPPCFLQSSCSTTGNFDPQETNKIGSTWRAKQSTCVYLPADLEDQPDHGGYNSELMPASADQFEINKDINYSVNECEGYISSCLIGTDYCEGELSEPNMLEKLDMLTDTTDILLPGSKDCVPPEHQVSGEFRSQEDLPISSFMLQLNGQAKHASFENCVSMWRMKGKRSFRNVGKRLVDAVALKTCCPELERSNGSIKSTYDVKECSLTIRKAETSGQRIPKLGFYLLKEVSEFTYGESDLIDEDLNQSQLAVYGNIKSQCSVHDSVEDSHGLAHNEFLGEPVNEVGPLLVDVDVTAQASCQGEHVPLVSLMSRLNGKAIIGHPIQIEILENGSANHLIASANYAGMDEGVPPQAMWWTARRTAMHRVPRSIPSRHPVRRLAKRFQKKTVKRMSPSSRKTRKLSSLASNERLGGGSVDRKFATSNTVLGGSVPPVTCVPVKVAFSRILEAIGGPSPAFARHVRISSLELKASSIVSYV